MGELEPNDSRVVHGNAKPEEGDERFAQNPTQAEQFDRAQERLDDDKVRNPESAPSLEADEAGGERGAQHEQSVDNGRQSPSQSQNQSGGQFQASQLDRGEAQYQDDPLVQQQHQQNDWSGNDGERSGSEGFETGQADYGSAQAKAGDGPSSEGGSDPDLGSEQRGYGQGSQARQELIDGAEEGNLSDDDIDDAAPQQARVSKDDDIGA